MKPFVYNAHPARVLFGEGKASELPAELERLDARRPLVLSTTGREDDARRILETLGAGTRFSKAVMHTPVGVTMTAMDIVEAKRIDCLVSVGGGSTTGLSKAIAFRTGLPQVILPTTYAGSEMTPILGQTENGVKKTLSDSKVLPEVVIYDVNLTLGLPAEVSGTSGINAIAHAVEAMYAKDRNPLTTLMAEEGIRSLSGALPEIVQEPGSTPARTVALYGAWLCGCCLGSVGMALHHKLCHTLGGSFGLPHAETHAALLPHAVGYNMAAEPEVMQDIAGLLGAGSAAAGLFDLGQAVGASMALKDLGLAETDLDRAADLALCNPYWNPRPIERNGIRDLLQNAWSGTRPI